MTVTRGDIEPGREPVCTATSEAGGTGNWARVCPLAAIPSLGARVWRAADGDIAVFRTADDRVFAVRDRCPHRGGPLSQGIVFGHSVACPLHGWVIDLARGEAQAPDVGGVRRHAVTVADGIVWVARNPDPADD